MERSRGLGSTRGRTWAGPRDAEPGFGGRVAPAASDGVVAARGRRVRFELGLQAGRRQRLVGRGRGVGLRAALALALGARGQAACRAGSGAGLKVTDQQDQSQLSQHRIWCKVEEQSVWRRWTARRQRRSEHAEMGLLGASSARPSRRAAEQRRVELTCRAAAAVRHRSTPSLPDDARHLPRRGRGVW